MILLSRRSAPDMDVSVCRRGGRTRLEHRDERRIEFRGHRIEQGLVTRLRHGSPFAVGDDVQLIVPHGLEHERSRFRRLHHAGERHVRCPGLLYFPECVAYAELRRAVAGDLADVRPDGTGAQHGDSDVLRMSSPRMVSKIVTTAALAAT